MRIAIRAGDILLAGEKPGRLSARNILEGKIAELVERSSLGQVGVDCGGTRFEIHVTRAAQRDLALAEGAPVWLIVKTYSCHVVDD